jgi:hypothetical protein
MSPNAQPTRNRVSATSRTAVYGPVRTVVWEGRSREAPPYPDLWRKAVVKAGSLTPNSRTLVGPSSHFPVMDWREFRFFNVLEDGVCITCAPGDQEDLISGNCG